MTKKPLFTFYISNKRAVANNAYYPDEKIINDETDLKEACQFDFVCAKYKKNHRSKANFIFSDCLAMDCDNDHSDNPEDWKTPEDIKKIFPDVTFAVQYSRHHNKPKENKSARPRFHVFFQIYRNEDWKDYTAIKKRVHRMFPWFDDGALDAARFFFGTEDPQVEIFEGLKCLDDLFFDLDFPTDIDYSTIPEGKRHNVLVSEASAILKSLGICKKAEDVFRYRCTYCEPPMEEEELESIWNSAQKFYIDTIAKAPGYIPPEVFHGDIDYRPDVQTTIGQAEKINEVFGVRIRYNPGIGYLYYHDGFWEEDDLAAVSVAKDFAKYQIQQARNRINEALKRMHQETQDSIGMKTRNAIVKQLQDDEIDAFADYESAKEYLAFATKHYEYDKADKVGKSLGLLGKTSIDAFDRDPFLLNTPADTYDLRKGLEGARKHDPDDLITKRTSVSPGNQGKEIFEEFLDTIFEHRKDVINFVQEICGVAAIGQVKLEKLIIAYGEGANGKSTLWNSISDVLGDYSGSISSETLTLNPKHNVQAEQAELRGKRFAIAAELGVNQILNDSILKKLCATDRIQTQKKFKSPFSFVPQHTLILYTNNLPTVKDRKEGTWRRLLVVPFEHHFEGKADKKNYGSFLVENAGPYILSWIIEGAKKIIDKDYQFDIPACVQKATQQYKENNDFVEMFLNNCCELGEEYKEISEDVYQAYCNFIGQKPSPSDRNEFWAQMKEKKIGDKFRERVGSDRFVFMHGLRLTEAWKKEGDNFDFVSDETESPKPVETEPDYGF